ncbi:MAG: hypothetical protein ABWY27_10110, partial [Telluria sp.]
EVDLLRHVMYVNNPSHLGAALIWPRPAEIGSATSLGLRLFYSSEFGSHLERFIEFSNGI